MKTKLFCILAVAILLAIHPTFGSIIRPVDVLSEEYVYNSAAWVIDNSGLDTTLDTGSSLIDALATLHAYDGGWKESYASTAPGGGESDFFANIGVDTDVDILLDLTGGGDVSFRSILLWQYQNNGGGIGQAANALRTLEIRINTEAEGTSSFATVADATFTMKPVVDGDTDSSNDLGGSNSAQGFNMDEQTGRYVLLSLTDNHYGLNGMTGGGDRVGLGEVRFATEAIPEPAVLLLILMASLFVLLLHHFFSGSKLSSNGV